MACLFLWVWIFAAQAVMAQPQAQIFHMDDGNTYILSDGKLFGPNGSELDQECASRQHEMNRGPTASPQFYDCSFSSVRPTIERRYFLVTSTSGWKYIVNLRGQRVSHGYKEILCQPSRPPVCLEEQWLCEFQEGSRREYGCIR